jgi:hypothetical protein
MTLRRDVYLRAAAAIAQMQEYLGNFSNVSISNEEHSSQLKGSAAALAQVELVGSLETLRSLGKVRLCFYQRSLDLMEKKFSLQQFLNEINEVKATIQSHSQEREQLSGLLQSPTAAHDAALRKGLVQRYEQVSALIDEELQSQHNLGLQFADHQRDLILAAIDALNEVGNLIAPAVVEVRRELDFKIDTDAYLKTAIENNDLAKERVARLFENLKASVTA